MILTLLLPTTALVAAVTLSGPLADLAATRAAAQPVDDGDDGDVRTRVAPSRARRLVAGTAVAALVGLGPALIGGLGLNVAGSTAAALAYLLLGASSLVLAFVDHDTLYIDLPTFLVGAVGSWALAIVATTAAGEPVRLLAGVLVAGVAGSVFEGTNWLFRQLRGEDGQGFGDTLLVLATAGVPAALTGSWVLGYWAVMAGMLLAVAAWVLGRLRGAVTRTTPFAFGPWLAAGWFVAWTATLLTR